MVVDGQALGQLQGNSASQIVQLKRVQYLTSIVDALRPQSLPPSHASTIVESAEWYDQPHIDLPSSCIC
jgi:hypothetical protein